MRVLRRTVGFPLTAEQAYSALYRDATNTVWLDSSAASPGAMSFVGEGTTVVHDGALEAARAMERVAESCAPLGWIGWLGYELRAQTMGTGVRHPSRYPDAGLLWVDRGIRFDHATGSAEVVVLADEWTPPLQRWYEATMQALAAQQPPVAAFEPAAAEVTWRYDDERYTDMVRACQAAIVEGEAYQLCLTTEVRVEVTPDPLAVYLAVRRSSATHHGALVRIDGVSLLSASPESFLTISSDGLIESKPIKGTRPRGQTDDTDAAMRAELLASEKERAENRMIVDLMRNDIGRVSEVGSVSVPSLLAVESYPHVHQLVSTVRGRLAPGLTAVDAVVACFPAGSMTGAPKLRATQLLEQIEQRARGIYSGVFGYFAADGSVDLAMVIRSIVLDGAGATIGTGGGITALSVADEELAEAKLKARALLAVLVTPTA